MKRIDRKPELLLTLTEKLSRLRALAYVSAGDCNLFVVMNAAFAKTV